MFNRLMVSAILVIFCAQCVPENEDTNEAAGSATETTAAGTTTTPVAGNTAGTTTTPAAGNTAGTSADGTATTRPTAGTAQTMAGQVSGAAATSRPSDNAGMAARQDTNLGGASSGQNQAGTASMPEGGSDSSGASSTAGERGGGIAGSIEQPSLGGMSVNEGGGQASEAGVRANTGPMSAGDGADDVTAGEPDRGGAMSGVTGGLPTGGRSMPQGGDPDAMAMAGQVMASAGMDGNDPDPTMGGALVMVGGNVGGARSGFGGESEPGGSVDNLPCAEADCPDDRPNFNNCPDGTPPRIECRTNNDELCEWKGFCEAPDRCPPGSPDTDNDGTCDAIDTLCNFDDSPVSCDEAQPANCAENEVPEVKEQCFSGRCVTWDECGVPPQCDDNIPCPASDLANCSSVCVNFRCVEDCVQCQDPGCQTPCLFGSRPNNDGCETCNCLPPPRTCPQEGGEKQRKYESIDPDFCVVNNTNCGVDREVFRQPGCGCGCQLTPCPVGGEEVCGMNGTKYLNECLMTRAGQQESADWAAAGCCDAIPENCPATCTFGYIPDPRGCGTCACNPAPLECPDESRDGVTYISGNPGVCAAADLQCPDDQVPFDDPICGCGCQSPEGEGCPLELNPVCGVDGQTYFNRCFATAAGTAVQAQGECPTMNANCVPDYVVCRGQDGRGGRCNGEKVVVPEGCTYPVCHCELPDRCPVESDDPALNEPGEFMCALSGECIVEDKVCDREPDCPGGTDEGDANNCPAPGECRDFEYNCGDAANTCILEIQRCNGEADCPGDDPDTLDVIESPDEQGCNCAHGDDDNPADQGDCLCPTAETYCNTVCEAGESQACDQNEDCADNDVCGEEGICVPRLPYANCI
ncbi:MAG: Kazal-type serine protease inhibitor domain-containing protein, partial [Myxococcota bacterium]|nr:Kazal-type serine protease inhibitor domain-containing protein [Myxococcota bacterium]